MVSAVPLSTGAHEGPVRTVGIAVCVPDPLAADVSDLRTEVTGPEVSSTPTHVTLLPPTEVAADTVEDILEHLHEVGRGSHPFAVRLCGTGTFQPVTDVVFLQVVEGGEQCDALQQQIRRGPLSVELRFPYHAHVTLAQNVDDDALARARAEMADVDTTFTVEDFVVYEGPSQATWSPRARITLGQGRDVSGCDADS
ncbi:MAG: 2'-5' RNA ligase family protein [Mobilicoccus sp.]|nr:2'-5' RNA ligase family protein [Mobilicoccus sp.]